MGALLAVGVFTSAACLRTESLGTEQTAVVGCEPTSCRGTPTVTRCADGTSVPSTGRCVQTSAPGRCDWEPGTCAVVNDTGASDTFTETPVVDSGSDALVCTDGSVALRAMGPWDESRKCYINEIYTFECLERLSGSAETCFVKLATGEYFAVVSTDIPSGGGYRECTSEERISRGGSANYCR